MKQKILTLLAAIAMMTGASAQETESTEKEEFLIVHFNTEQTDSMYNVWNAYVQIHPKDEVAWRNLFALSDAKIFYMVSSTKDWKGGEQLRKQLNVVGRMRKAIPGTYTFYYSAYKDGYIPEEKENLVKENDELKFLQHDEYADSAIATLPANADGGDYETWIQYLIPKCDTIRINNLLKRFYESGLYPEGSLQYHYNELQGMDEGAVYLGANEGDIIGKLILQRVLGVHQDKILYDENAAMIPKYLKDVFEHIGIPFDEKYYWDELHSMWQEKTLAAVMKYIFKHSKIPVYLSAHNMWTYNIGEGLPDEIKACLYNEGLTMRYSAKPYDNRAVKRRNIEKRYRLEYLRMPFHPEAEDTRLFTCPDNAYAIYYMHLLHDQLPYYKKYNKERYQWLRDIFTDIIDRLEKQNFDVDEFKAYLK